MTTPQPRGLRAFTRPNLSGIASDWLPLMTDPPVTDPPVPPVPGVNDTEDNTGTNCIGLYVPFRGTLALRFRGGSTRLITLTQGHFILPGEVTRVLETGTSLVSAEAIPNTATPPDPDNSVPEVTTTDGIYALQG